MKKFLSYILLAVMCVSLLTGCNTYTTDDTGDSPDGRAINNDGIVRDNDGIIDDDNRVYTPDGRTVRDGIGSRDGSIDDGSRAVRDGVADGNNVDGGNGGTRNGVGNVTDNTNKAR